MGESLKGEAESFLVHTFFQHDIYLGKDHRMMPLLYALAVYAVSETDIAQMDLPEADKVTIKKVCITLKEYVTQLGQKNPSLKVYKISLL